MADDWGRVAVRVRPGASRTKVGGAYGERLVVGDASDDDGLAIMVRQNAAEVAMEFLAQGRVLEKRSAFLGREDGVDQDFREGLRHGVMMGWVMD